MHRLPDERIEIFFARDLHLKARSSTRASFEIVSMSYEEAEAAVLDGSITDAKPLQPCFGHASRSRAGIRQTRMTPFQRPSPSYRRRPVPSTA